MADPRYHAVLDGIVALLLNATALGCGGQASRAKAAEGFRVGQRGSTSYAVQAPVRPAGSEDTHPTSVAPGLLEPLGPILNADNELDEVIAGALSAGVATSDSDPARAAIGRAISARAGVLGLSMTPSGPPWFASLRRGAHAVAVVQLASGACYAIVGSASDAVVAFQINLVTGPPRPPQVLAQSNASQTPDVGVRTCLRNDTGAPLDIYVDLSVVRGEGIVGAQAFHGG